jgi:hypothetical protein
MAHVLSAPELAAQRLPGQWSKSRLIVPQAHTIYTARLNGVPSSNDMVVEITVDTESGTRSNVLPDMTLYVGSVAGGGTGAGAYDLGMCRIRKTPIATKFYIAEASDIVWVDNAYLTIVDDYQLWAKPLRIVSQVPYMDWDIAYSDQHADFDPVPIMGSDAVARLINATVDVQLGTSADVSEWVIGSTIASRLWTIAGATAIDDNTAVNPVATFNAPGTYLAYCAFTAANGKTYTGVRYVVIYNDADPGFTNFQIRSGRISRDSGGCSFEVNLYTGMAATTLRKRSKVILCADDFAGVHSNSLPGQIPGRENHVCLGWISDINTSRQSEYGEISFTVESAEFWMKKIRDYPSGLEFVAGTAAAWTQMPTMTVRKAVWHFLHWRSTATRIMDCSIENDARYATRFMVARSNLWERVEQVIKPTIWGGMGIDQFGRLFVEIEPQMVPEADRTWPNVMTITDDDIEDEISWSRRDVNQLAMLFLSGVSIDASGSPSSFFSMSPGHSYAHHGDEEIQDNFLVAGQANANQLCGLYYGWRNNDPYDLGVNFVQSFRVVGVWPRQKYTYSVSAANDPRGIGFTRDWIVRSVSFGQSPDNGFMSYSAELEPEAIEGPAINGDVPTASGIGTWDFSTFPPLKLPPLPSLPPIEMPSTIANANHPKKVVIATSQGVFYTTTFNEASPVWIAMNNGLSVIDRADIYNMVVTPAGAIYVHIWTGNAVWRAASLGGAWVQIAGVSSFANNCQIGGIGVNPYVNDTIAISTIGHNVGGLPYPFGGVGGEFALAASGVLGTKTGNTLKDNPLAIVFNNNKWFVFGSYYGVSTTPWSNVFSSSGSLLSNTNINTNVGQDAAARYTSAYNLADTIFQWDASGAGGYNIITSAGTVATRQTGINPNKNPQGMAFAPTGVQAMGADQNVSIVPYKTTDSGGTWSSVGGVIPVGPDCWCSCKDISRWIFAGGTVVRLTVDQGTTYVEKTGNLSAVAPLVDVINVQFVSDT